MLLRPKKPTYRRLGTRTKDKPKIYVSLGKLHNRGAVEERSNSGPTQRPRFCCRDYGTISYLQRLWPVKDSCQISSFQVSCAPLSAGMCGLTKASVPAVTDRSGAAELCGLFGISS
mmetsp:Transcript_24608/g.57336  ORF Transcript_24608/g.57336 Transcript_24608/m.57336 type:complete len:116 (+) Transcript_24608:168-515(+)